MCTANLNDLGYTSFSRRTMCATAGANHLAKRKGPSHVGEMDFTDLKQQQELTFRINVKKKKHNV